MNSSTYFPFCCQKCIFQNTHLVITPSYSWGALQSPGNSPAPQIPFHPIPAGPHSPSRSCPPTPRLRVPGAAPSPPGSLLRLKSFRTSFKVHPVATRPSRPYRSPSRLRSRRTGARPPHRPCGLTAQGLATRSIPALDGKLPKARASSQLSSEASRSSGQDKAGCRISCPSLPCLWQ